MGDNCKKFSSRDGGTVKLLDLFDESIEKIKKVMTFKNTLIDVNIVNLAIGSIKCAHLKSDKKLNYKFSYEKMLSFNDNTLFYIMYGYIITVKVIPNYYKHYY